MAELQKSYFWDAWPSYRGGGHLILVLYTCMTKGFQHTLIAISPLEEKHAVNENFVQFCPQAKFTPKQAFLEDMFGGV